VCATTKDASQSRAGAPERVEHPAWFAVLKRPTPHTDLKEKRGLLAGAPRLQRFAWKGGEGTDVGSPSYGAYVHGRCLVQRCFDDHDDRCDRRRGRRRSDHHPRHGREGSTEAQVPSTWMPLQRGPVPWSQPLLLDSPTRVCCEARKEWGLLSKDPAKELASQGGGAAAKARAAEECAKRGVPRGQSSPAAILNAARHTHRLG